MFNGLNMQNYTIGSKIILGIFIALLLYMLIQFALKLLEMGYVLKNKKPYFVHFYTFLRRLSPQQNDILKNHFIFFNKLSEKDKTFFEHRVASFINDKDFIGRGIQITGEMKILLASTAVMLTFGFRDFYIGLIQKIVVYPDKFYSKTNKNYHKGEFNPKLKTLVISWADFKTGYEKPKDNINLGIHEFVHAIHLNSLNERDISSTIFTDTFEELTELLAKNHLLRDELTQSHYLRNYAFTNQFEFLAVTIETFIESPQDLKLQFPEVYYKIRQMLNFDFAGY